MPHPLVEQVTTHFVIRCPECDDTTDDDLDSPPCASAVEFARQLHADGGWRYLQGPPGTEEGWYCGGCVKELLKEGFVEVEVPVVP